MQELSTKTSIAGITKLKNKETVCEVKKRSLSGRVKPSVNYGETFFCDYECGFSTKVLMTMSNHVKRHHGCNDNNEHQQIHQAKKELKVETNHSNCHGCSFEPKSKKDFAKHINEHKGPFMIDLSLFEEFLEPNHFLRRIFNKPP